MRSKFRLLGLLAVAVASVLAMNGIAAGSASAATECAHVKAGESGAWEDSACTKALTGGKWIKVEDGTGMPVPGEPGVRCFKVAAGEPSAWKDNECTKAEKGGGYIKVIGCVSSPIAILGQGSSLQKIAQEVWIGESGCPVTYTTSSSGTGRKAWGVEEAGHKPNDKTTKNPAESGDTFIGTDEALGEASPKQIKDLDEAAGGTGQTLVIPVLQAAVAAIVHPPSGCTPHEINNKSLLEVWNGTITKWSEIKPEPSGTCTGSITRVVRQDVSGTTFVFKTYLSQIEEPTMVAPCNKNSWKKMAEPENNKVWPESEKETCPSGLSPVKEAAESGGGGEVKEVKETVGAIGYANLGDARNGYVAKELEWLNVQNNGVKESSMTFTPTYADPGTAGTEPGPTAAKANCANTEYGARSGTGEVDDDLSGLNGAHPTATNYPICTLTYDVALVNYTLAEFPHAAEEGAATKEYLEYVTSTSGGQTAIAEKHDYDELPETATSKILQFAQEEAKKVDSAS